MKKVLFTLVTFTGVLFLSCSRDSEPSAPQQVTFHCSGFTVEQQSLSPLRRSAQELIDDGNAMTDLYLFNGSTQLVHQVSTQEDFGTITVLLPLGEHHLHFVATRSTGLSYDASVLSCTSLRPTFGKHLDLSVSGASDNNVALERITGQLSIIIEDEVPAGASTLTVELSPWYRDMNVTTFAGVTQSDFSQTINITGRVGTTNNTWTINIITPSYGVQYEPTYTLTARNGSDQIIGQATGTVPLVTNTKTILRGSIFQGNRSVVTLNTAWNADINESF